MKTKLPIIYFLFFCWNIPLTAVHTADTLKIPIQAELISLDILQHIYAVDTEQRIIKFNTRGEKLNFYQNSRLGKVQQIDVSNPHKILVFYRDQQTIIFLDRNMTELSRIELNRLNLSEISTAGVSNDNQVWVFDEFENSLKKIDGSGSVRTMSESTIGLWGKSLNVSAIRERFNRVFLLDSGKGIFIFDNLGNPVQSIELKGITDFSVFNANTLIVRHTEMGLGFYRLSEDRFFPIEWPENLAGYSISKMRMAGNNLLLLTDEYLIYIMQ